ncbi:MAG: hypothetical protein U0Y10_03270 [Spirosomataceae bacterium]
MLASLRRYWAKRALKKRIRQLTSAERQAILSKSPLEAVAFQGEGYHVFRKDLQGAAEAYICTLGEVEPRFAEDWIIEQYLTSPSNSSLF